MIVPKHLHHVRPSTLSIERAKDWLMRKLPVQAVSEIYLDDRNLSLGVVASKTWSLHDSHDYVEQVLMKEEKTA